MRRRRNSILFFIATILISLLLMALASHDEAASEGIDRMCWEAARNGYQPMEEGK